MEKLAGTLNEILLSISEELGYSYTFLKEILHAELPEIGRYLFIKELAPYIMRTGAVILIGYFLMVFISSLEDDEKREDIAHFRGGFYAKYKKELVYTFINNNISYIYTFFTFYSIT